MLISISKRAIFLANSKTGSTTIEAALTPYSEFIWAGNPRIKHATWVEVKEAFKKLFDNPAYTPEKFLRFGVIREPADWILSWYNYRQFTERGGIPVDMTFEEFWNSDDWVKKKNQASRFLDEDGVCRFDLIIPMTRLSNALPMLFEAMGVKEIDREVKNKSKGALTRSQVAPELMNEINDYYSADWQLFQEWERKFETVFPETLNRFYGLDAKALPQLPQALLDLQFESLAQFGVPYVIKHPCDAVDLVKVVLPEKRSAMKKSFTLKGVVVPKAEQGLEDCRLVIEDATGLKQVEWGLPSPQMGNKYPGNPLAMKGRFKVNDVILGKNKIATVWMVMPNGTRARMATIGY